MLPKLKISTFLLSRLERVKQQCSGCLFGVVYGEGVLLLVGFNVESTIGQFNYEQIQHKFPAELDLCGLVKFGDCTDAEAHLTEIFKDVDITDNPILLHCELGTLVGLRASIFMHGKLQEMTYKKMDSEQLFRDFCFTRSKCSLVLYTEPTVQVVRHEMQRLRKVLSNGSLAFQVDNTRIFITNAGAQGLSSDNGIIHVNNESFISDIVQAVVESLLIAKANDKENHVANLKKSNAINEIPLANSFGALGCKYDVVNINVLRCKTLEPVPSAESTNCVSNSMPAMSMCVKREERKLSIPLEVEAMAMLCKTTKVSRLYDILIESLCRSLRLVEQSITERLEGNELIALTVPRSYHFYPQEFGHFLSCSYLDGVTDNESTMQDKRKRLHRHFGLPVTRPYFRRSNHCIFLDEISSDGPLLNVHIGVRPSGVVDGVQHLVQGNYFYYHYMQQLINDKGWGCAYRSLQTICSWFQLQGYTERNVPTHREIQEYLVSIHDKPQSFIGSTQWIGSTEVSMCLQGFLNVDSKIKHLTSGAEMSTIFSDLSLHFQTQGTPIMIGGGVLAHTIIGVDFALESGQVKFLILDPHYTGNDDLQTIQSKGWCGWKGVDFWDKRSYYNLCMPQRPVIC